MAGLTLRETSLNDLRNKAIALTSDAVSLSNLFAEEADRLNRMHMASQLRALHSAIVQQLQVAKKTEDFARYSNTQANIVTSLGRLVTGGVIKMVSQDNRTLSAFGDQLLRKPAGRQCPFGKVLVCIDSRGLPDGVGVVSVSHVARESNREEGEVTSELRERGCLLFSEKEFSFLIDKLIEDVQGGRLLLPVSLEKLPRIRYTVVLQAGRQESRMILPSVLLLKKESGEASETPCKNPHAALYGGD